ncbi:MAG: MATE family efflux transporter [Trueperaceae bacterium]|nr:MATE family efflux transporter [Trueperaceae bacterium]
MRRPARPFWIRTRREFADLLRVAGPLILAQIAQMSMSLVDTLMAGRLGQDALAGIALGSVVFMMVSIVCMGVLFSVAPHVSQAHGAGDAPAAGRAARQGVWLALLLSLPAFALFQSAEPLLLALGQDAGTAHLAGGYLRWAAFGFPASMLLTSLRGFLEGISDTRPVMVVLLIGIALNVVADNALMFGRWGFPQLGLIGTGVATAFVYSAMAAVAAAYVALRYPAYRVLRGLRRPDPSMLRALFRIGWPIGLTLGFEAGLFSFTALLMGLFGQAALAGHQIAVQAASVTFMIPVGIAIATGVRVGQAVGREDPDGVRRAGLIGVATSAAFMFVTAAIFRFAPGLVVSAFLDRGDPANADAVAHAVAFLGIAALFQVVDGIQVSASGALRGLRDTRAPMAISLVSYWLVGMSVATVLAFPVGWEGEGLWAGLVAGLGLAATLLLRRFLRLSARAQRRPFARA